MEKQFSILSYEVAQVFILLLFVLFIFVVCKTKMTCPPEAGACLSDAVHIVS